MFYCIKLSKPALILGNKIPSLSSQGPLLTQLVTCRGSVRAASASLCFRQQRLFHRFKKILQYLTWEKTEKLIQSPKWTCGSHSFVWLWSSSTRTGDPRIKWKEEEATCNMASLLTPIWQSRALLLGRSNIFKCKCRTTAAGMTYRFNFASRLGCLTRGHLPVWGEIRNVPHRCRSIMLGSNGHRKCISHAFLSTYVLKSEMCTLLLRGIKHH